MTALELPILPALTRARVALALSGWELKNAEIDTVGLTVRIEVSRGNRHVTLDARNGRAQVSRESWDTSDVPTGRRGDRFVVTRIAPRFLGRERFDSLRSAVRSFAEYLDANGSGSMLASSAISLLLDNSISVPVDTNPDRS